MMKIAICDDELPELDTVVNLLCSYNRTLEYATFESAKELLSAYDSDYYDIVLLDIEMKRPNGYDIAKRLKELNDPPLVVFVTKSSNYVIRGYEVAFRYLQKPISMSAFSHVMNDAISEAKPKHIPITDSGKTTVISVKDIVYIEAFNYYLSIHTVDCEYRVRRSLKSVAEELQLCNFVRPHNSFLVHMPYIQSATSKTIIMQNNVEIPISRNRRAEFEEEFRKYLRG